jgi:hypothetical protein
MKNYTIALLLVLGAINVQSQRLVDVMLHTIPIFGKLSVDGYARNTQEVVLPRGTISYIVRVTPYKIYSPNLPNKLLEEAKKMPLGELKSGSELSKLVAANALNDAQFDFFIFSKNKDAENFYQKEDKDWTSCKAFVGAKNTCFSTDECITPKIWLGFRNNSGTKGLDVMVEIIALVDEDQGLISQSLNEYKITNGTTATISFSLSTDGKSFTNYTLDGGTFNNFNFNEAELFIKIKDGGQYKINPTMKYKIQYNSMKKALDLAAYK